MKKHERAQVVRRLLNKYVPDPKVPLHHSSRYTLLIAVLLSARCTDERVNQITPELFALASTPEAMAQIPVEAIRSIIRPCGLSPTKARAIQQLSKQLCERHGGRVPSTFEELEELPGVGHKTASVVMAQGFHQPAFPVDTHIHRCAKRWGLSKGTSVKQTEKDLKALFPKSSWSKLHLQIILYARRYCPARTHQVSRCPICEALHSTGSAGH
jgi:endonuclease III